MRAAVLTSLAIIGAGLAYLVAARRAQAAYQPPEWYDAAPMGEGAAAGFYLAPAALGFPVGYFDAPDVSAPSSARWVPPESAAPYLSDIQRAEREHALPEGLLARVLYQESRYRPDIITGATRSPVGAMGIAQFMPATAQELGVDPLDPSQAIAGAALYLRRLYNRFGTWADALAAYNWGQGNVARKGVTQAPAETRRYVADILTDTGVS